MSSIEKEREQRLAAALRENLKRRKSQSRQQTTGTDDVVDKQEREIG